MESDRAGEFSRWCRAGAGALILLLAAFWTPTPASAGVSEACAVPDSYLRFPEAALDRTEALVEDRRPVRVLLIGPELAASGAASPVPALERALERRFRGIEVSVFETQTAGLADQDFERLRNEVASRSIDLVVWQVGVPDALALSDVESFEEVLNRAADWAEGRGLDIVLVDPPFVPHVGHERIYRPYVGGIGEMSQTDGVPVLRRYAAMQYWNIEREKRRRPLSDFVAKQPCVAELLAEAIWRASAPPPSAAR
jgi:acyl-CoA thioesterase I